MPPEKLDDGHGCAAGQGRDTSVGQSEPDEYRREVEICGPGDIKLLIYPAGECYRWKIVNDGDYSIAQLRLEVVAIGRFRDETGTFRMPVPYLFRWPLLKDI